MSPRPEGVMIGKARPEPETGGPDDDELALVRAVWPWQTESMVRPSDRAVVERYMDAQGHRQVASSEEPFSVPEWALERHTLVFGGSGYGKSYFSYALVREQLRRGCSLVVIDPKPQTVYRMRAACEQEGLDPQRVFVIDARNPDLAPPLNLFLAGGDPAEVAGDITTLFERTGGFTGSRMKEFLFHAIVVAAWHGLRLSDVPSLLWDDAFRASVLSSVPLHAPDEVYGKSVHYFLRRYKDGIAAAEKKMSVNAVENKFLDLLHNRLFLKLFDSRENRVDFASLFRKDRPQTAVLACFRKGGGMSEETGMLLAGILVHLLEAAAVWGGDRPVVLAIDEFRKVGTFLESVIRDVANMARESNLRLLVAAQHPRQLPEGMREDLEASSAVKVFFNPGHHVPARHAAEYLSEKDKSDQGPVPRIGPPALAWSGPLYAVRPGEEWEGPQPIIAEQGSRVPAGDWDVDPREPGKSLSRLADHAAIEPPILFENGHRVRDLFMSLPKGASATVGWQHGRAVAQVRVPRVVLEKRAGGTTADTWSRRLLDLGNGEAVVTAGGPARTVRIVRVSPPADASQEYAEKCRMAAYVVPVPEPEPEPAAKKKQPEEEPDDQRYTVW